MAPIDDELHTLVGAYVMDAVTDAERVRFARHLAACAECRAEIRELQETAAQLGTAEAMQPRPELKSQTIRAASRISQLPPPARAGAALLAGLGRREGPHWAAASRVMRRTRLAARGRARGSGRWRTTRWRGLALAASAALAACAVTLGLITHNAMRQLDSSRRQNHMIAAVLGAPDVVMLTAAVRTGGTATLMMSHRRDALVFTAHGLHALPAAQAYELWLMGPDGDKPAGMLRSAAGGMAGPAVVAGLGPGDMIGLTVEPAAGSPRPTSAPILLIAPEK